MRKKTGLLLLGIALVGVLIFVALSGTSPQGPAPVADKPTSPVSISPDDTIFQAPAKKRATVQKSVAAAAAASDIPVGSAAPSVQPQTPTLEPEIRDALGNILNTSSEGLVEETHNGVTSVDLQGRFRTAPVATVDESGNVQITDYTHLPKVPTKP